MKPLEPIWTAGLFPALGRELVGLLESLGAEQWTRPTVCSQWSVRDVAAHLLDSALRRTSADRDEHVLPPNPGEVTDQASLIGFLDRLNAEWVTAHRRLSPRLLTELLGWAEVRLAATLESLDPDAPARFPVSWAGEEESKCWFDVARELTERWLHQQQIRLAVGAEPLTAPDLSRPVFDTFLRVLPHQYREVEAGEGDSLVVAVEGAQTYDYTLTRGAGRWLLAGGSAGEPTARVELGEETAWLSLTKGLSPTDGRARARTSGPDALIDPFFEAVAVMA